jgi:uncharacterized SAM-binding protein YcdF (DUF218 family)
MNWEAVLMIGGAAIFVALLLSALVVGVRRKVSSQDTPLDESLPKAAILLYSGQTLLLLAGLMLYGLIPQSTDGWLRAIYVVAYLAGVIFGTAAVGRLLEKRGVRLTARKADIQAPDTSTERAREKQN